MNEWSEERVTKSKAVSLRGHVIGEVASRVEAGDSVSQMRDQSEASKYAAETVTQVSTTRRLTTSCLVPKTTDDVHCYGNGRDAMPTEETFFFFESQRKIEPATQIYL